MSSHLVKFISYFIANVTDPRFPQTVVLAYSVSCYSCMSSYFETQWGYINHMYKKPMVFNDACNFESLDIKALRIKNCSDMCIWLRMEDRVGGRVRYGYLRGCMSDVLNYNHTTVRFLTYRTKCTYVKFADIFVRGSDYGFKKDEYAMLCACHTNRCNGGASKFPISFSGEKLVNNFLSIFHAQKSSLSFSLYSTLTLWITAGYCLLTNIGLTGLLTSS